MDNNNLFNIKIFNINFSNYDQMILFPNILFFLLFLLLFFLLFLPSNENLENRELRLFFDFLLESLYVYFFDPFINKCLYIINIQYNSNTIKLTNIILFSHI